MLLFAAHDPGARNHIRPIYNHALGLGEAAEFVDLFSSDRLMDDDQAMALIHDSRPEVLIAGCSLNQAEWPLVRAGKRSGIKTAVMVDIGAEDKLDPVEPADFPDRFLVTNPGCRGELIEFGASPETIVMTGSAHIELLSQRRPASGGYGTKRLYGLASDDNLAPLFCGPDTDASIEAVLSLAELLPTTQLNRPAVVVWPHPCAPKKERLESACRQFEYVHYDAGENISGSDLLVASRFSLAMASTVSLESLVLGVPSAFYQIGWDFLGLDRLYRNIDGIPRIRQADDLKAFVGRALDKPGLSMPDGLENYQGALGRIWKVIGDLRGRD